MGAQGLDANATRRCPVSRVEILLPQRYPGAISGCCQFQDMACKPAIYREKMMR